MDMDKEFLEMLTKKRSELTPEMIEEANILMRQNETNLIKKV